MEENAEVLGFQMIRRPAPSFIVTQAFILCAYCSAPISATGGPRHDSLCMLCVAAYVDNWKAARLGEPTPAPEEPER